MNEYVAHLTISIPVKAKDADAAYDVAYDKALMDLNIIKSPFLIEHVEIKEGQQ